MRFDHSKTIHRTIKLLKKKFKKKNEEKKIRNSYSILENDITVCIEKGMIVMEVEF